MGSSAERKVVSFPSLVDLGRSVALVEESAREGKKDGLLIWLFGR